MSVSKVPMVRCRLDGPEGAVESLRYIPLAEFELWRYLMETRHGRQVVVEEVSVWVAEESGTWNSGFADEELQPVVRLRLERPSRYGVPIPMERYYPAETYPQAQEALLSHFEEEPCRVLGATPGYFVPAGAVGRRKQAARFA
ncbi:MAG: hypothetical protein DMF81_22815 [Acidobacteria bacterium]|nr:MAG: hypothetical protein DMF81_22815 [Acidobacteriota bacterium]